MTLARTERCDDVPVVSVIVPARNEEACIGRCLESLVGQTGVAFEVIVVDDGSTDRTREIAESFTHPPLTGKGAAPGEQRSDPHLLDPHLPKAGRCGAPAFSRDLGAVTVIEAGALPPGWYGKANACVAGAKVARGKWLLFTDADTMHRPGSLARSVAEAEAQGAELLSYSPEQEVHGLAERALMPLVFAELAVTFKPKEVSDPASPAAAANGQYLLVSRAAYEAVGGHAAVAGDVLEDVALARLVKKSGRRLQFRFGGDAVRTRMYRSWGQMREGWTKNLALLFPDTGRLALLRALEFVASVGAFSVAVAGLAVGQYRVAIGAVMIAVPT